MRDKLKTCLVVVVFLVPWLVGLLCCCIFIAESLVDWLRNPFVSEMGKRTTRVLTEDDSKSFKPHLWALGCGSVVYDYEGNVLKKGPPCGDEKDGL